MGHQYGTHVGSEMIGYVIAQAKHVSYSDAIIT